MYRPCPPVSMSNNPENMQCYYRENVGTSPQPVWRWYCCQNIGTVQYPTWRWLEYKNMGTAHVPNWCWFLLSVPPSTSLSGLERGWNFMVASPNQHVPPQSNSPTFQQPGSFQPTSPFPNSHSQYSVPSQPNSHNAPRSQQYVSFQPKTPIKQSTLQKSVPFQPDIPVQHKPKHTVYSLSNTPVPSKWKVLSQPKRPIKHTLSDTFSEPFRSAKSSSPGENSKHSVPETCNEMKSNFSQMKKQNPVTLSPSLESSQNLVTLSPTLDKIRNPVTLSSKPLANQGPSTLDTISGQTKPTLPPPPPGIMSRLKSPPPGLNRLTPPPPGLIPKTVVKPCLPPDGVVPPNVPRPSPCITPPESENSPSSLSVQEHTSKPKSILQPPGLVRSVCAPPPGFNARPTVKRDGSLPILDLASTPPTTNFTSCPPPSGLVVTPPISKSESSLTDFGPVLVHVSSPTTASKQTKVGKKQHVLKKPSHRSVLNSVPQSIRQGAANASLLSRPISESLLTRPMHPPTRFHKPRSHKAIVSKKKVEEELHGGDPIHLLLDLLGCLGTLVMAHLHGMFMQVVQQGTVTLPLCSLYRQYGPLPKGAGEQTPD